jgi:uncharacterized protein DUF1566
MRFKIYINIIVLGLLWCFILPLSGQTVPQAINFEGVLRNASGDVVQGDSMTIRFTILDSLNPGTMVYQETKPGRTNGFGLFLSDIGTGTPTFGTFAGINWLTGSKYLQVEWKQADSSNYINFGTTPLVSVPYSYVSQYALSSANVNGTINAIAKFTSSNTIGSSQIYDNGNNVGVATPTPDSSAQLEVSSTTRGFLPPRLSQSQINAIALPTEGLMLFNTTINKPQYFDGTAWRNFDGSHYFGEPYAGGIVFYIDSTGQHGLVAATSDQSTGSTWYNGGYVATGATGTALGTGAANTAAIISAQGTGSYAASICAALTLGGYTDWFLPSKDELNQLYINLANPGLGNISNYSYWSSTEYSTNNAWFQYLTPNTGAQQNQLKVYQYYVRAIRAF